MKESGRPQRNRKQRSFSSESGSGSQSNDKLHKMKRQSSQAYGDASTSSQNRKLYLGGVPVTMNEDELRAILSKRVKRFDLHILRHKDHGNSKGCAWIEVYNEHDFHDLLSKKLILQDKELPLTEYITDVEQRKKRMNENHERQCFFGGLPLEATKEHVDAYFSKFGTVTNSYIIYQEQNKSRGFGFVEFETSEIVQKVLGIKDHKILDKDILVEKRTTKTALKHNKGKDSKHSSQIQKSDQPSKTETSMISQPSFSEERSVDASSYHINNSSASKAKDTDKGSQLSRDSRRDEQKSSSAIQKQQKQASSHLVNLTDSKLSATESKNLAAEAYSAQRRSKGVDVSGESDSQSNFSSFEPSMASNRDSDYVSNSKHSKKMADSQDYQAASESANYRSKHRDTMKKPEKLKSHHASDKISNLKQNSMSEYVDRSDSNSVKTTPFQQKQSKKPTPSQFGGSAGYSKILDDSWKFPKDEASLISESEISEIVDRRQAKHNFRQKNELDPDEERRILLERELAALNAKKNQSSCIPNSKAVPAFVEPKSRYNKDFNELDAQRSSNVVGNAPAYHQQGRDPRGMSPVYQNYQIPVQNTTHPVYESYFTPGANPNLQRMHPDHHHPAYTGHGSH